MSPAQQLATLLIHQRTQHATFDQAWDLCWPCLAWPDSDEVRSEWRTALIWARPHFQDAYEQPHQPPVALMLALDEPSVALVDREAERIRLESLVTV